MNNLQITDLSYRKSHCFYKEGQIFHKKKYWHLRRKVIVNNDEYYISARQRSNYKTYLEHFTWQENWRFHKSFFTNNYEIMIFKNDIYLDKQWRLKYRTNTKRLFYFLLWGIKKGLFKNV